MTEEAWPLPLFPTVEKSGLSCSFITHTIANRACNRWHYMGKAPDNASIRLGLWDGLRFDGACVITREKGWGVGVANYWYRLTGGNGNTVCELSRLALRPQEERDKQTTAYISIAFRVLRDQGYEWVFSYSDQDRHAGTLYKAASFLPVGETLGSWYWVRPDGMRVHRRVVRNRNKDHEHAQEMGYTKHYSKPKMRWVFPLTKRARKQARKMLQND